MSTTKGIPLTFPSWQDQLEEEEEVKEEEAISSTEPSSSPKDSSHNKKVNMCVYVWW